MKKRIAIILTGVLLGTLMTGCGPSGSPAGISTGNSADSSGGTGGSGTAADGGNEFVIALDRDTNTLDPVNVYNPNAYLVERSMVEALTTNDAEGNIVGNLAESWEVSGDGMRYTFHLREDVYFWDGTQMTAEDVKFCLERVSDEKVASSVAWMNASIDSIETDGDFTVIVKLKYPDPAWIYYSMQSACSVYSKSYCEAHPDDFGTSLGGIMGTGPYVYEKWVEGEYVTVTRNENYWNKDAQPVFDRVKFVVMSDKTTLISAFKTGEVDYHSNLNVTDREALKGAADVEVLEVNTFKTQIMFLNTTSDALSDVNCRRALACCWDAAGYQENIWGDAAAVGDSCVLPPGLRGSEVPEFQACWDQYYETAASYEYNIEKAKEYLAQSHSPDGFELTVTVSSADSTDETAALYLQNTAALAGIQVSVEVVTPSERTGMMFSADRTYDALIVGWDAACEDPGTYVYTLDIIENIGDGGSNISAYYNEEVDRLLTDVMSTMDEEARVRDLTRALQLISEDCITINLCYPKRILAKSNFVEGELYDIPNTEFITWVNRMHPVE